jgi:hypothetical protein
VLLSLPPFDEITDNARRYGTMQVCRICQKTAWVAAGIIAPPQICRLPTRIAVLYRFLEATKRNGTCTVNNPNCVTCGLRRVERWPESKK